MKKRDIDDLVLKTIEKNPITTTELRLILNIPWATLRDHVQNLVVNAKVVRAEEAGTQNGSPFFRESLRGGLLMTPDFYKIHSNGIIYAEEIGRTLYKKLKNQVRIQQEQIEKLSKMKCINAPDLVIKYTELSRQNELLKELLDFQYQVNQRKEERNRIISKSS